MALVLDSGALIALERGDRAMWERLEVAQLELRGPITHGGIIGQVWRGGRRQARLAMVLHGVDVRALDDELGRRAGQLLARTQLVDVIDAALVLLANDGDEIATSDPGDIEALARAADLEIDIIVV